MINLNLKCELIRLFGSQVEAAKRLGIRESKLSYIVRGHASPNASELDALKRVLGRGRMRRLLKGDGNTTNEQPVAPQ